MRDDDFYFQIDGMRISRDFCPDVDRHDSYFVCLEMFWRYLAGVTRAGACGGPLKRDVLSIHGDDLSGKVL